MTLKTCDYSGSVCTVPTVLKGDMQDDGTQERQLCLSQAQTPRRRCIPPGLTRHVPCRYLTDTHTPDTGLLVTENTRWGALRKNPELPHAHTREAALGFCTAAMERVRGSSPSVPVLPKTPDQPLASDSHGPPASAAAGAASAPCASRFHA